MRKEKVFVITDDNRDKGKEFVIVEPSAWEGEKFASKLLRNLSRLDFKPNAEVMSMGLVGLASIGVAQIDLLNEDEAESVKRFVFNHIYKSTNNPEFPRIKIQVETEIEEVSTIRQLIDQFYGVTFGFLDNGGQ